MQNKTIIDFKIPTSLSLALRFLLCIFFYKFRQKKCIFTEHPSTLQHSRYSTIFPIIRSHKRKLRVSITKTGVRQKRTPGHQPDRQLLEHVEKHPGRVVPQQIYAPKNDSKVHPLKRVHLRIIQRGAHSICAGADDVHKIPQENVDLQRGVHAPHAVDQGRCHLDEVGISADDLGTYYVFQ